MRDFKNKLNKIPKEYSYFIGVLFLLCLVFMVFTDEQISIYGKSLSKYLDKNFSESPVNYFTYYLFKGIYPGFIAWIMYLTIIPLKSFFKTLCLTYASFYIYIVFSSQFVINYHSTIPTEGFGPPLAETIVILLMNSIYILLITSSIFLAKKYLRYRR